MIVLRVLGWIVVVSFGLLLAAWILMANSSYRAFSEQTFRHKTLLSYRNFRRLYDADPDNWSVQEDYHCVDWGVIPYFQWEDPDGRSEYYVCFRSFLDFLKGYFFIESLKRVEKRKKKRDQKIQELNESIELVQSIQHVLEKRAANVKRELEERLITERKAAEERVRSLQNGGASR